MLQNILIFEDYLINDNSILNQYYVFMRWFSAFIVMKWFGKRIERLFKLILYFSFVKIF